MIRCTRPAFDVIPTILAMTSAASGNTANANVDDCALPPDMRPCDGVCPGYFFNFGPSSARNSYSVVARATRIISQPRMRAKQSV